MAHGGPSRHAERRAAVSAVDGDHGRPERCQFVELPDGTTARLYGDGKPLSDDARDAFATIAKAARELFAEHADGMPALAEIADAFAHRARTSGLSYAEAGAQAGCDRVATIRLMQCSAKLAAAELAAFARWAGCEQMLTAALDEIERRRAGG